MLIIPQKYPKVCYFGIVFTKVSLKNIHLCLCWMSLEMGLWNGHCITSHWCHCQLEIMQTLRTCSDCTSSVVHVSHHAPCFGACTIAQTHNVPKFGLVTEWKYPYIGPNQGALWDMYPILAPIKVHCGICTLYWPQSRCIVGYVQKVKWENDWRVDQYNWK